MDRIHSVHDTARQWPFGSIPNSEVKEVAYAHRPLRLHDIDCSLIGIHKKRQGSRESESFTFTIGVGDAMVELFVAIDVINDTMVEVSTSIERFDNHKKLPRGLGRVLYQSLFPFLQDLSTKRKKAVTHIVEKNPSDAITPNDWDRIFLSMISQQGYSRISNYQFRKIYQPVQ